MITIATNMAGRGTDIVLGGNIEKPTGSDPRRRLAVARREGQAHRRAQGRMAEGA
jgi:preprotein translocase subunit SecA